MSPRDQRLRPRKVPRQRRAEETRERILDAAARVFAERGYAHGTTNRIALEAGLSVGSLYQYYPGKDAILVELMDAHIDRGVEVIARHLADPGGLPDGLDGRLRLFVRAAVDNHVDNPRLHRVLFEEAPRPPDLLDRLRALEGTLVAAVADLLHDDPEVEVDDPRLAARMVVGTIESLTHRFIATDGDRLDADAFVEEVVAMLAGYLTGSPGSATGSGRPRGAGRSARPPR